MITEADKPVMVIMLTAADSTQDRVGGLGLARAAGPPLRAVECHVDQDPARVSGRMLHGPHLWPVPGDPQQGLLDEVFGFGQVPGHEVSGPQQRAAAIRHESLELLPGRARSQPLHPDSILCHSHRHYLYQPLRAGKG